MAIRFTCSCGQPISARDEYAGRRVQCNGCKKIQTVPGQRGGVPTKLSTSRPAPTTPPPAAAPPTLAVPPPLVLPLAPHSESPLLAHPVTGSTVLRVAAPVTMTASDPRTALVRFRCLCGGDYQARPEHAGKPTRCPRCGEVLFIPDRAAAATGPVLAARERTGRYAPAARGLSLGARLGVAFLVLLLLGAAGYGAWEFYFKGVAADVKKERQREAHALDFVSADAVAFLAFRPAPIVEELLNKKVLDTLPPETVVLLKTFPKQFQDLEKRLGFSVADIKRIVAVIPTADVQTTWTAVELTKNTRINRDKLKDYFLALKEQTYEGRQYFTSFTPGGKALYFVDDHLYVFAEDRGMKAFLGGKVRTEGPLAVALQRAATGGDHLLAAFTLPAATVANLVEKWPSSRTLVEMKVATLSSNHRAGRSYLQLDLDYGNPDKARQAAERTPTLVAEGQRSLKGLKMLFPPAVFQTLVEMLDRLRATADKNTVHLRTSTPLGQEFLLLGLLLPSVQKVREAAGREAAPQKMPDGLAQLRVQNNLKQITLALIMYADANGGRLPPAVFTDPQGQPLYSWRVAILPYMEEESLYRQFRLNERWDSPHNRRLLSQMPKVFQSPGLPSAVGNTYLQVFTGPNTPFPVGQRTRYPAGFLDGTTNTILVVEGANAVPWTAPQDLVFGRINPVLQISRGFVGMADGSVRRLPRGLSETTTRAAITPSGRDRLGPDWGK